MQIQIEDGAEFTAAECTNRACHECGSWLVFYEAAGARGGNDLYACSGCGLGFRLLDYYARGDV